MGDSFVGTPCHTFAIGDQDGNKQNYWWGGGDGLDGDGKQYFLVLKEILGGNFLNSKVFAKKQDFSSKLKGNSKFPPSHRKDI